MSYTLDMVVTPGETVADCIVRELRFVAQRNLSIDSRFVSRWTRQLLYNCLDDDALIYLDDRVREVAHRGAELHLLALQRMLQDERWMSMRVVSGSRKC